MELDNYDLGVGMKALRLFAIIFVGIGIGASVIAAAPPASTDSVAGLYRAILQQDGTDFYQEAHITLRTVNPGNGTLKISANVRIYFGDSTSTEFLTYEFDDCQMNLLTRQINIKDGKNDVSFVGKLKEGRLEGEWFSTIQGKVGVFDALKMGSPAAPRNGVLVKTLTGYYRGQLENTHPESNLPERISVSLVTTQDTTTPEPTIRISGNVRLYLGDFGSWEYVETKVTDVQYNFFSRYLSFKTADYGLTFKGKMSPDGVYDAKVFADGLGEAAEVDVQRH